MLKRKIKFPDPLGSLVKGFDENNNKELERNGMWEISASSFEFGEELETIHPDGSRVGTDRVDDSDAEKPMEEEEEEELIEPKIRTKPEKSSDGVKMISRIAIAVDERRSDLEYELSQEEINLEKLQRIASNGIPDGGSLRATTWKLLLGYLPPSRSLWDKVLADSRVKYSKLKEELLSSPSNISTTQEEPSSSTTKQNDVDTAGPLQRHDVSNEDHPLSLTEKSVWHKFFEYTEIAQQIDRDLERTHPEMKFFSGDSPVSKKTREAMKNILLLFAKLNPATRYVQGMNEVLAIIYCVFSTDTDEQNAENAEADSFACFVRLLSDSVDHFCQQLDNSSSVGILFTLTKLKEILKVNDKELWRHLEFNSKVNPQFYAFRWITLLLTQEFEFNVILRIWDSLLSHPFGVQDMLLRVCCALLLCVKGQLLGGDFAANLYLLQHYPAVNIEHVIEVAKEINTDTSSSLAVSI